MSGLAIIVVMIVYAVLTWWLGFASHRQWLIKRDLERMRRELKPGYQLAPAWFAARRKALLLLSVTLPLIFAIPLAAVTITYLAEFRFYHIFMGTLAVSSPIALGWWGIIPIPGIEIDT